MRTPKGVHGIASPIWGSPVHVRPEVPLWLGFPDTRCTVPTFHTHGKGSVSGPCPMGVYITNTPLGCVGVSRSALCSFQFPGVSPRHASSSPFCIRDAPSRHDVMCCILAQQGEVFKDPYGRSHSAGIPGSLLLTQMG